MEHSVHIFSALLYQHSNVSSQFPFVCIYHYTYFFCNRSCRRWCWDGWGSFFWGMDLSLGCNQGRLVPGFLFMKISPRKCGRNGWWCVCGWGRRGGSGPLTGWDEMCNCHRKKCIEFSCLSIELWNKY